MRGVRSSFGGKALHLFGNITEMRRIFTLFEDAPHGGWVRWKFYFSWSRWQGKWKIQIKRVRYFFYSSAMMIAWVWLTQLAQIFLRNSFPSRSAYCCLYVSDFLQGLVIKGTIRQPMSMGFVRCCSTSFDNPAHGAIAVVFLESKVRLNILRDPGVDSCLHVRCHSCEIKLFINIGCYEDANKLSKIKISWICQATHFLHSFFPYLFLALSDRNSSFYYPINSFFVISLY